MTLDEGVRRVVARTVMLDTSALAGSERFAVTNVLKNEIARTCGVYLTLGETTTVDELVDALNR